MKKSYYVRGVYEDTSAVVILPAEAVLIKKQSENSGRTIIRHRMQILQLHRRIQGQHLLIQGIQAMQLRNHPSAKLSSNREQR